VRGGKCRRLSDYQLQVAVCLSVVAQVAERQAALHSRPWSSVGSPPVSLD